MFLQNSLIFCTVAALVSAIPPQPSSNLLVSPCPEIFNYEMGDKPGQWSGSLVVRSNHDLKGVWIRLLFDKEVKDVTVDQSGCVIKIDENKRQVKVQNGNLLLNAYTEKNFKISVTYDGTEAPRLVEYRLNARTICPQANMNRTDVFQGDLKSDYFLPSLTGSIGLIPQPTQYKCGISQASNVHPWQATIYVKIGKDEQFVCEATLISPSHVITAAHCVTFIKEHIKIPEAFVTVYLGQEGASKDAVRSLIDNIKVHPGYEADSLLDDIAILKLVSPIKITDTLRPICLGERKGNDSKVVLIGHEGGKLLESNILMVDFNECSIVAPHLQESLTYETYCVSYRSDDKNCAGDSGSGLITIGTDGIATLEGIVTLGVRLQNRKVCDQNSIVLISGINRYLSWIKHVIY